MFRLYHNHIKYDSPHFPSLDGTDIISILVVEPSTLLLCGLDADCLVIFIFFTIPLLLTLPLYTSLL